MNNDETNIEMQRLLLVVPPPKLLRIAALSMVSHLPHDGIHGDAVIFS